MGNYQGYQQYKDSGVEWLGDIPEHWEAIKGKFIFCILSGYAPADFIFEDEGINYYQVDDLNDDSDIFILRKSSKHIKQIKSSLIIYAPFILFPKRGAAIATNKVKIVDKDSVFDTNLMAIKTNSNSITKFIAYVIFSRGLWDIADVSTVPQINNKHINPLFFPLPPLHEQQKIAQFLDYKTKQIDQLIKKKETLIEKLDEKRTALISHAVTKGLDSNVPMKDSGIEWLGDIPKHWEVKKLQYMGRLKSGENIISQQIDKEGLYPVFGGNGLRGYFDSYTHDGHYILIGRQGALCGNINYANGKFWASEHAVVITPSINFEVYWLGELLKAMNLNQYSNSAAQPGLSVEQISRVKIPCPCIHEQKQIAEYLDQKTSQIDLQKAKIKQAIEILKEYRTSLITNAVTGKIDVRQIAIP